MHRIDFDFWSLLMYDVQIEVGICPIEWRGRKIKAVLCMRDRGGSFEDIALIKCP